MGTSRVRRAVSRALRVLVIAYIGFAALLYLFQDRAIYFPDRALHDRPSAIGLDYESIILTTEDRVRLSAWFVPVKAPQGVILFCHGNAGNISDRLASLSIFHALGYSVLVFDYRGYGESEGGLSEEGTYRDARAAWDYLARERKVSPDDIVIFGRSLGGAVAAHLAAQVPARALILESTFTSIPDRGAELYPFLPIRWLCRYTYNTRAILPRLSMPVLILHSREDEMIPFHHGEDLFRVARAPKKFVILSGDHNGGFLTSGDAYTKALADFLKNGANDAGNGCRPRGTFD